MEAVEAVIEEGLAEVEKRNPEESGRLYHGIIHTKMVMQSVQRLAGHAYQGAMLASMLGRFGMAGAWHDVVCNMGPGENEDASAALAEISMRRHGFTEDDIEAVKNLIRATKYHWVNGVLHQEAERMGLPDKIMADADLCCYGADTEDFIRMSYRLMAELAKKPLCELTEEDKLAGWNRVVKFMSGRKFLTPQATFLLGLQLVDNLTMARRFAKGRLK